MSYAKKLSICAVCIALCYALPLAFHALALGSLLSPMHLPVLLCGLVCGWPYGLVCGIVGPILSSVLSAMPAASQLVYMVPELCVYGWCAGLLFRHIRTGNSVADLYCALIPAMLAGPCSGRPDAGGVLPGGGAELLPEPVGQRLCGGDSARNRAAADRTPRVGAGTDESAADSAALPGAEGGSCRGERAVSSRKS